MKRISIRPLQTSALAIVLAGVAAAATLSAHAREEAAPASAGQAILVLDASGSMWAEMKTPEGRKTTRIETARETISSLLDDLPSDMELGLIAYGHRRKGDCKDIQTLIEPGKLDKEAFRSTVNKLSPKGMTPLTDAVKQAAQALRYTEQKATVILVTDGLETCAPDACAAARSLEESGIDFTAHVIGFGLTKEESEKVACIAENTGGKYLEAQDAASLSDALGEVVMEPAEPIEQEAMQGNGPWYPGEEYMDGYAIYPTGQTTDAPKSDWPADVEIPDNGTPAQCQAACEGDEACAAWIYEPPGSYFVPYARCHVYNSGAELDYYSRPGEGWVSGIRSDALMLVRPLEPHEADASE